MEGHLNVDALERALREVVRRHEALRTRFRMQDGYPVQDIASEWESRLTCVDLRELDQDARIDAAQRLAREDASAPFDLVHGPLLRACVLILADREHVLLLTLHHIVSDAWSMSVLVREVASLYAAFERGEPSRLPELAVQYGDYAVWQRQWLQGAVLDDHLAILDPAARGCVDVGTADRRAAPGDAKLSRGKRARVD